MIYIIRKLVVLLHIHPTSACCVI